MSELVDLVHEPLVPPRPTFTGECAFSAVWKATMTAAPSESYTGRVLHPIDDVLWNLAYETTQREASILASMASWLGTNCGQSILYRAEHALNDVGPDRYLMAWAAENARKRGINGFRRTIEAFGDRGGCIDFTARDLEAIDSMMQWLSTHEGQRFLAAARAEDEQRRRARDAEQARLWRESVACAFVQPRRAA